ncbi:MAG: hypothetical protein JW908_11425 [Anaerolineales bacterium]|nr:hypothetical protein [Anaerolineales bacterium]
MKDKFAVFTLVILLLVILISSSCSLPKKTTPTESSVTTPPEGETAATPTAGEAVIATTPTPTASSTKIPATQSAASPTPALTDTPLPTPTHISIAVSLPKKSSITGETIPSDNPVDTWISIPIPDGAITGQQKKNERGRYYIYTIQTHMDTLLTYYSQALDERDWLPLEGSRADDLAVAFYTKKDKFLRLEIIIEDASQNLLLVRIFKWSMPYWYPYY